MMDARSAIMARLQDALGRSQRGVPRPVPRDYIQHGDDPAGSQPVVDAMVESLEDYSAAISFAEEEAAICDGIDTLLGEARSVVVPEGLPEAYRKAAARSGRTVRVDTADKPLSKDELDNTDAVLTCSRLGIAISGTVVLDGEPDQGRRAISLVPDTHIIVVERDSIVTTVPEAVAILGQHPTRPLTWIAGPSATADIELVRIKGVHGPRNLGVVIAH